MTTAVQTLSALRLMETGLQVRSIARSLGLTREQVRDIGRANGWVWSPAERLMIRGDGTRPRKPPRPPKVPRDRPARPPRLPRGRTGDLSWQDRAACHGADLGMFFPEPGANAATVAKPKAICARCPVRGTCLDDAMVRGERWGIWGGMTETERRDLRRSTRKAAAAA